MITIKHFRFTFPLPTGKVVANIAAMDQEMSIKGALNNALKDTEVRIKEVNFSKEWGYFSASYVWKKGASTDRPSTSLSEDLGQIFLDEGDYS